MTNRAVLAFTALLLLAMAAMLMRDMECVEWEVRRRLQKVSPYGVTVRCVRSEWKGW